MTYYHIFFTFMSSSASANRASINNLPANRFPAEWEPQAALWLSWPLSERIWPGKHEAVGAKFGEIAAVASRFQRVCINAAAAAHEQIRTQIGAHAPDWNNVRLYDHATDDVWCRDHGPVFVKDAEGKTVVTDWEFNAWGGKFRPFDQDNSLPQRLAQSLGLRRLAAGVILEGGAVESNGAGVMLTTDPVLLNPNRNPRLSRADYETLFRDLLGITETVWLPAVLANDDTDGHIDNLARFAGTDTVLVVTAPELPHLEQNREILERRFTNVLALPNPDPVRNAAGEELPASYANFVLLNGAVLLPTFAQPKKDAAAAAILKQAFPDREVVGIDCCLLVEEGGSLHCISCNQPL